MKRHSDFPAADRSQVGPYTRTDEAVTRRRHRLEEVRAAIRQILYRQWADAPNHYPQPLHRWEILERLNAIGDLAPVSVDYLWDCLERLLASGMVAVEQSSDHMAQDVSGYVFELSDREREGKAIQMVDVAKEATQ